MKFKILLMMLFGLAVACQSGSKGDKTSTSKGEFTEVSIEVSGMHCAMCEASIEKGVGQIAGVDSVKAVLDDSTAYVRYNPQVASVDEIKKAIEQRGYKVKGGI